MYALIWPVIEDDDAACRRARPFFWGRQGTAESARRIADLLETPSENEPEVAADTSHDAIEPVRGVWEYRQHLTEEDYPEAERNRSARQPCAGPFLPPATQRRPCPIAFPI